MEDDHIEEPSNFWAGIVALIAFLGGQGFLFLLGVPVWVQVGYCLGFIGIFFGAAQHHSYVFVFRVYVPIVVSLGLTWFYVWIHDQAAFSELIEASQFKFMYLQLLFDVLSALYAICTAFLLWKGLSDHDTLRHNLRDEANQIQRVLGFLHYFDLGNDNNKQVAHDLRASLRNYVINIRQGEKIQAHEENEKILRNSVDHLKRVQLEDDNDKIALAEVMKSISDLVIVRSKRISQMEISMSPYFLAVLVIMSATVIYPFFTDGPINAVGQVDYVNATCIFVLGGLLSFLQMTLFDISTPFDGYWKIKTDAFKKIQEFLEEEIRQETL